MSIDIVRKQIIEFLKSDEPGVLSIVGMWGVGKTTEWNKVTREFKSEIALKSYSYVSLFGLKSLAEIKEAVFLNSINTSKIGDKPDLKGYAKRMSSLAKDASIPVIERTIMGVGNLIGVMSQLSLTETVICFDDIERRSDSVEMKDFMGLVTFLRDQKKCKVVLLFNDDADDITLNDYEKFKEKVVDRQVHFSPTPAYCFDTTFKKQFLHRDLIREYCTLLNIVNRRVLLKIKMHIDDHLRVIQSFDQSIHKDVVIGITVLSWCHYGHGADSIEVPSLDYALDDTLHVLDAVAEDDGETHLNKKWNDKLSIFDYAYPRVLLPLLGKAIRDGFVSPENLLDVCRKLQQEIEVENRNKALREAWNKFHFSFDGNEDEVAGAFEVGLRTVVADASVYQYCQGVSVLRLLDKDKVADALVDLFIAKNSVEKLKGVDDEAFAIEDRKSVLRIKAALQKIEPPLTVEEILEKRRGQKSYNEEEANTLAKLSENEIYHIFTSYNGPETTDYIRVFRLLSNSSDVLRGKVDKALLRIKKSSRLNAARLRKFEQ